MLALAQRALSLFEDLPVERGRTPGHRVPAELAHRALPSGLAHTPGGLRVAEHRVEGLREARLEVVVHGDEYARLAVVHDLGNPADPRGHDGSAAGHRL